MNMELLLRIKQKVIDHHKDNIKDRCRANNFLHRTAAKLTEDQLKQLDEALVPEDFSFHTSNPFVNYCVDQLIDPDGSHYDKKFYEAEVKEHNRSKVKLEIPATERAVISDIVSRIKTSLPKDTEFDCLSMEMDIVATHANGCPLDLLALLHAPQFEFTRDVLGIRKHINRETGKLKNFFSPRYAI